MVGRGLGLETLCLYLAIARVALLDLIVALGLPTPPDRPHRRATGRWAWRHEDVAVFIELWMANWRAGAIAERFGRKPGAIWAKARQLGLPRRDRKSLTQPADPHAPWPPPAAGSEIPEKSVAARALDLFPAASRRSIVVLPPPALVSVDGTSIQAAEARPPVAPAEPGRGPRAILPIVLTGPVATRPVPAAASMGTTARPVLDRSLDAPSTGLLAFRPPLPEPTPAPVSVLPLPAVACPRSRLQIQWTPALDLELSYRHFGFQDNTIGARAMGVSEASYRSRKTRLELPPLPRGQSVPEFNEDWARETIEAYGMKRVKCRAYEKQGVEFWFWCRKKEHRIWSKLAKSKAWFRDAVGSLDGCVV
jgi:hypothetical protein